MAGIAGSVFGGWLIDAFGGKTTYAIGGGLSFIAALMFLATVLYERSQAGKKEVSVTHVMRDQ